MKKFSAIFKYIRVTILVTGLFNSQKLTAYNPVHISGHLTGTLSDVKSVKLAYYSRYLKAGLNSYEETCVPDVKGNFDFTIHGADSIGKINYLVIFYNSLRGDGTEDIFDYDQLSNFVVEPGDNVRFAIDIQHETVKSVRVTGRGADKYQCRSDIMLLFNQFILDRHNLSLSLKRELLNPVHIDTFYQIYHQPLTMMLLHLQKFKHQISPSVFEIMTADVLGQMQSMWEHQVLDYYFQMGSDSSNQQLVNTFYFAHNQGIDSFNNRVYWLGSDYPDYIYWKELAAWSFNNRINTWAPFQAVCDQIKKKYKGELRDRLLKNILTDPLKNGALYRIESGQAQAIIDSALAVMQSPEFKEEIDKLPLLKLKSGTVAFPFELPDSSGNIIKLVDLKGKAVLMDMWFTGCTGCAMFTERIKKEIRPKVTNFENLQTISICTDELPAMWQKSLRSGKYSDRGNINLFMPVSGAKFFNNPMNKYYNIEGLPFILLIDKNGRIIAQFTNASSTEFIINSINSALSDGAANLN